MSVGLAHGVVVEGEHRSRAISVGPSKSCPCPEMLVSPLRAK
jgi:hypothetical protein